MKKIPLDKKIVLVTAHRRESFGKPLESICNAVKELSEKFPEVNFVFSVHLNPNVQKTVHSVLAGKKNVFLIQPLDYPFFVQLMKNSYLILTDSGGMQEEAPSLNKPVLVLRNVTERTEAIKSGTALLAGTEEKKIIEKTTELLSDKKLYEKMSSAENPFGNGTAAEKIISFLRGK